eukprot:TRINITY_DN65677_c0_g1_i1.p1 TRINITY_DN65677_c0_g1~~TRINITY_DN65677_c0_g1_i1.p1  ORF type:complete len:245 (+),score=45.38 TRINITY_DN65677_c0_g1_i1:75-737(+)
MPFSLTAAFATVAALHSALARSSQLAGSEQRLESSAWSQGTSFLSGAKRVLPWSKVTNLLMQPDVLGDGLTMTGLLATAPPAVSFSQRAASVNKVLPIGEGAYQSAEAVEQRTTDKRTHCEHSNWKDCFEATGDYSDVRKVNVAQVTEQKEGKDEKGDETEMGGRKDNGGKKRTREYEEKQKHGEERVVHSERSWTRLGTSPRTVFVVTLFMVAASVVQA